MDLMFQPFRKFFDFQGRARRSEYWLFVLLQIICYVVAVTVGALADGAVGMPGEGDTGPVTSILYLLVLLVFLIPSLSVGVRRLHDSNKTGWLILIGLIPFVGGLIYFVLTLLDGTPGPNQYGPDPKGRGGPASPDVADTFS